MCAGAFNTCSRIAFHCLYSHGMSCRDFQMFSAEFPVKVRTARVKKIVELWCSENDRSSCTFLQAW